MAPYEISPFLRIPSTVLKRRHASKRRRLFLQQQSSGLLELPSEIVVTILEDLDHVSRCAFGLTCKDLCRLACRAPHNLGEDTGFTVRHEFMTFLSEHWIPHRLHFCFYCNHLREVDELTRNTWYDRLPLPSPPDTPTLEPKSVPAVPHRIVNMKPGKWSQWKIVVKNEQKVTAWCPDCVEKYTLAMQQQQASARRARRPILRCLTVSGEISLVGPG